MIIKCYLRSVEVNIILKITDFTGTVYLFIQCLHNLSRHFGNRFIQILRKTLRLVVRKNLQLEVVGS